MSSLDESRTLPLTETFEERKLLTEMEELYAIMRATEHLENAYIRDLVPSDEYKGQCSKLIRSYELQKSKLSSMGAFSHSLSSSGSGTGPQQSGDISTWMRDFSVNLPQAHYRLELVKLPATDTHYNDDSRPDALIVSETTSSIITAQDALRMGQTEIDQLAPFVQTALESLNKHSWLGADFESKNKLQDWVRLFNGMRASDSLSPEQSRQLLFDLDQAYSKFVGKLGTLGGSIKR